MMEREKFMQEARLIARRILEGKENGIMNLVQQAWAEGKRNAEVETLRAAIDEALDRREPKVEPAEDAVYPTWADYISKLVIHDICVEKISGPETVLTYAMKTPIPADIAEKLGIEPKED